ncbi:endonuclease/exonuclease/phosphatase family protein [Pimelobacter simplex]|uniref:endonuclease/exonuclease/phosphatase family protein n=1 Tax=Nocardioides simplex TaxID=2045 RepID=UPI00214F84A2|nr:endonuclease/exonuclease/phosphatase family protein [Pimelobacter simplex]UUW89639.1 endonuclease/exonuclease/phosphatase family protein [Pimelobacter simplex]UUW93468.1 endonuclease/exonuclease/phosphatase family protein [Pimelobacter simplex]
MTYNVKNNSEQVNGWMWPDRRPHLVAVIRSVTPSILGIQEGNDRDGAHPADDLSADLAEYDTVSTSASPGSDSTSIFWQRDRFTRSFASIRRFSGTAATPCQANDYWNVVELDDLAAPGKKVRVANLHLIPGGLSDSRAAQLNCTTAMSSPAARHAENNERTADVIGWINRRNQTVSMPTVVLGDLNSPSTQCSGVVKAPDRLASAGYSSVHALTSCNRSTTWDKWATQATGSKKAIDYIFRSVGLTTTGGDFASSQTFGGKAPSDHRPFYARYRY